MVKCHRCNDVDHKTAPPRCLFLDVTNHKNGLDCVIVGMNPGKASKEEEKRYREHEKRTYKNVRSVMESSIRGTGAVPYYKRARSLVRKLGWSSILWTEICKCQCKREKKEVDGKRRKVSTPPSLQTFRTCIANFLEKELDCEETQNMPIVALGNAAFTAVAYRFPSRCVIGVPHPSGSRGRKFSSLFENDDAKKGGLRKKYRLKILDSIRKRECVRIFPDT